MQYLTDKKRTYDEDLLEQRADIKSRVDDINKKKKNIDAKYKIR